MWPQRGLAQHPLAHHRPALDRPDIHLRRQGFTTMAWLPGYSRLFLSFSGSFSVSCFFFTYRDRSGRSA